MEGKTLFLKFNTGPSGHGMPAAAGEAVALKRAGAGSVRVFAMEGEAGLTPGSVHETMNSAWGLGLDNLYLLVDWNDFGIDLHCVSDVVPGTPEDWLGAHRWRVYGAENGSDWASVTQVLLSMVEEDNPEKAPGVAWMKTQKGRGYFKFDAESHGVPHAMNSELFWETKRMFAEKYDVQFANFGGPAPQEPSALQAEFRANLQAVIDVLMWDQPLVDYLADRLVQLGDSVPHEIATFQLRHPDNPFEDPRIYDYHNYPDNLYEAPGKMIANRAALARWGSWVNALGAKEFGRPLFMACSADLAGSTNISGFAEKYGDFPGYGWFERCGDSNGTLLPQEITEFANSGIVAGLATVNFSNEPEEHFNGFWGACSTYGSFSYLKYGMFRLFSQLAQDCQWKVGKVLWVVGHSGPETADDSRTHFGIFAPGVTQLFPKGSIINLHPWEFNEVPVVLGAALRMDVPIVALHLTRPPIELPDRQKLGMPSHFAAAQGAYILRDYTHVKPRDGTLIVQGTSAVANVIRLFPEIEQAGWNLKIVCAVSPQLFADQPEEVQKQVLSDIDRLNSTVITTQARWLMHDWIFNPWAEEYALSSDWDDRWRTGGTVDEVLDEAHLSKPWLLKGIEHFVQGRAERLGNLKRLAERAME
jgi:transketolase